MQDLYIIWDAPTRSITPLTCVRKPNRNCIVESHFVATMAKVYQRSSNVHASRVATKNMGQR